MDRPGNGGTGMKPAGLMAHPAAGQLWRRLSPRLRARLRPLLGLPQPQAPTPAAPAPRLSNLQEVASLDELRGMIAAVRAAPDGAPHAIYHDLCAFQLTPPPIAAQMRALDPFSAEYAALAMQLADTLRGRPDYLPSQDERLGHTMQDRDLWTGLSPWDFRDPQLMAEFFDCYAGLLRQLGCAPGASILEYGPGSGQFLLALARLGYRCHAVDIEGEYLTLIQRQAAAMGVTVACEEGVFGEGFLETRFDVILFFEAFHHAPNFLALLRRLRHRLNPGGRLILCGEPIFPPGMDYGPIPYPWGPRLDALSIEAFQRGWMELGFQLDFLMQAFTRTGWHPNLLVHPTTFRANMIVASLAAEDPTDAT